MKTLTRLLSAGFVLAVSGASLAADCPNAAPGQMVYGTGGVPVARYSYRSGYAGTVAPMGTMTAPRAAMSPYSYTPQSASLGPERHLDYARARQHVRGW